ncbi:MAG: polysaccharide lyase 8 family protein [Tannerella sp.]|jgi:hyaluronate lyase|nr:polysaccharide lyase 8 family protein [Tannerella sp.]
MNRIIRVLIFSVILQLFGIASGYPNVLKSNDGFDVLRLNYLNQLTGNKANLADSLVIKRLKTADDAIHVFYSQLNREKEREYLWNDENCQDGHISPFRPLSCTTPLSRLSAMAVAYATKGSGYYRDRQMKKDVLEGLEWMYEHKWSPKHPAYGNWWDWVVGMPFSVENILVAMYDEFTPVMRSKYIEALDYYTPDVTYEGASTGANKVWQCFSMALRGIIAHDNAKIQMGIDGLQTEFKIVRTHDGFYEDGSFVQHQWHPYTGGYGASFLGEMARITMLLQGSKWELPSVYTEMLCHWIENAYMPLIFNGVMMDMVRGREIAREAMSDQAAGQAILLSAYNIVKYADKSVQERLLPRIRYELTADMACDFLALRCPTWQLTEMRAFLQNGESAARAPEPYHKQFSAMDRVVHRGRGFALGLAMSSNRIENYETLDRENMKSWHTGDGMTYLYTTGQPLYSDGFWATVDYYRLPGITVDAEQMHEAQSLVFGEGLLYPDGYKSLEKWVGGASLEGKYGMVGMSFRDEKSSLRAKKTWFMVGDEIAALGTGINSTDNRRIETIIDNRKISGEAHITMDGNEMLSENGSHSVKKASWAHFGTSLEGAEVGYYFPEKSDIQLMRETRQGSWKEISFYGNPQMLSRDYFTLWTSHGKNPENAGYTYVLLPCKNVQETKEYAARPNIKILANTPYVQAVQALKERVTGWNFWEAATTPVAGVSVDAPASVIIRETEDELFVGVSDPTQSNNRITVTVHQPVKAVAESNDAMIALTLKPELTLLVDVTGALGSTKTIRLKKK